MTVGRGLARGGVREIMGQRSQGTHSEMSSIGGF